MMPFFVFLSLGLLQLGLLHQARLLTKYAAYKAARSGSIHSARHSVMEKSALAVLLPMVALGAPKGEAMSRSTTGPELAASWANIKDNRQTGAVPIVEVDLCNPTQSVLGDNPDFDDVTKLSVTTMGGGGPGRDPSSWTGADWQQFDATRLNLQVTFYYRLVIPFANGVLWWITVAQEDQETMRLLRMNNPGLKASTPRTPVSTNVRSATVERLKDLARAHEYVLPIRANFGLRMHSNFFPRRAGFEVPEKQRCRVPFLKYDR